MYLQFLVFIANAILNGLLFFCSASFASAFVNLAGWYQIDKAKLGVAWK